MNSNVAPHTQIGVNDRHRCLLTPNFALREGDRTLVRDPILCLKSPYNMEANFGIESLRSRAHSFPHIPLENVTLVIL